MPVVVDFDDGQESVLDQLLAMRHVWRDLERCAPSCGFTEGPAMAVTSPQLHHELQELIAALDRRVPRVERAGEMSIAREAAALRAKAMKRLAELNSRNIAGPTLP